jgi:exopolysaccharide production protein ExoF
MFLPTPQFPSWPRLGFVYLLGICATLATCPALSMEYRLGSQDKLRIKVIEWRAGQSEYQEWSSLSADYTVSAAGRIALPLLGEITAANRTTEEVARAISIELQKRPGLIGLPEATVEIIQYRPVYIVGDVDRPGEYPFRPGLNVLQAIGIAGGFYRPTEGGLLRIERDKIIASGNYENARLELRRMYVRRARLEAELADKEAIRLPAELSNDPEVKNILSEELTILLTRRDALKSQLAALSEMRSLYAEEIRSLESKIATQEKQVSLAQRELKNVSSLVDRGLSVSSRQFGLERILADSQSGMLDVQTALVRAQQELRKTQRDAANLVDEQRAKASTELRDAKANIEQLLSRMSTSQALVNEAAVTVPGALLQQMATPVPHYFIQRRMSDALTKLSADEGTLVFPGDVLHVELHRFGKAAASQNWTSGASVAESGLRSFADERNAR